MKDVYFAKRAVYEGRIDLLGPFSRHQDAELCASDCLYPEQSSVISVSLENLKDEYVSTSSYPPDVQDSTPRYFVFLRHGSLNTSAYPGLRFGEEVLIDKFSLTEFRDEELTEQRMVFSLTALINGDFESMYEVRELQAGVFEKLISSVPIARVVKTEGYKSRRQLLDLTDLACDVLRQAEHDQHFDHKVADYVTDEFWDHFVCDGSSTPEIDIDTWLKG